MTRRAADANDANETVLAGPYPDGAFDEHLIANWSPDGTSVIFMVNQGIWQVIDNVSFIRGRHAFKVGVDAQCLADSGEHDGEHRRASNSAPSVEETSHGRRSNSLAFPFRVSRRLRWRLHLGSDPGEMGVLRLRG